MRSSLRHERQRVATVLAEACHLRKFPADAQGKEEWSTWRALALVCRRWPCRCWLARLGKWTTLPSPTSLLQQLLSEKKKKKNEEEERRRKWLERRDVLRNEFFALQAVPLGRRSPAQVSRLHAVAEAVDDVWEAPSSQPGKRKRKKRRKKKLPEASSSRSSSAFAGRPWKPEHYFLRALCLWQSCSVSGYCSDRGHMYMRQSGGFWNMHSISTGRWPSVMRSIPRFLVLWIFWEVTSGTCSWTLRACLAVDTRVRVSPRGFHRISHIFFVLVDSVTHVSSCPSSPAVTCLVSASPEEYKNN